jgi:hypothetical protein
MEKPLTEKELIRLIQDGIRFGVIRQRCNIDHVYNKLLKVAKDNEK